MSAAHSYPAGSTIRSARAALHCILAMACFVGMLVSLLVAVPAQAAESCGPEDNAIVSENSKPGSPWTEWEVQGAGDDSIQGFATDISVNVGSPINLKIDTDARTKKRLFSLRTSVTVLPQDIGNTSTFKVVTLLPGI